MKLLWVVVEVGRTTRINVRGPNRREREERRELSCNSLARTSFSVSSVVATAFAGLQIIECVAMPLMLLFL